MIRNLCGRGGWPSGFLWLQSLTVLARHPRALRSTADRPRVVGVGQGASRTCSLTAITLSGEQTVAGVAVVAGDRVSSAAGLTTRQNRYLSRFDRRMVAGTDRNPRRRCDGRDADPVTGCSEPGCGEQRRLDAVCRRVGTDAVAFAATL